MSPDLALSATTSDLSRSLPPPFSCSWTFGRRGSERVHVAGELDIATTPQLDGALRASQARAPVVELDLRDLAFMDSTAVHVIVDAAVRAAKAEQRLILMSGRPDIERILALTGIADDVEVSGLAEVRPRP